MSTKVHSSIITQPIPMRIALHQELIKCNILPTCGNCTNSVSKPSNARPNDAFCDKFKQFPPIEVVLTGCPAWEDDDIPF